MGTRQKFQWPTGLLVFGFLLSSGCTTQRQEAVPLDSRLVADVNGQATNLVCPGAVGCEVSDGHFRVGAGKAVITPLVETWTDSNGNGQQDGDESFEDLNGNGIWDPVWIAGFGTGRAATGVHDDVWTRVITMERGNTRLAVVSLDLVGLFHPDVVALRLAVQEAGLEFDHITVASTHQHEGPDTMGIWGKSSFETGYDPHYIDFVIKQTVEALRQSLATMEMAAMRVGLGEASHLVTDTRLPEVMEQSIHTINFERSDGSVITSLVVWGNHPEALGNRNTLLTSDYPHYLREKMEAAQPGSVAVFFSGILGGLTTTIGVNGCPDHDGVEQCPQGTFERAQYIGEGAAAVALESLARADVVEDSSPELSFRRHAYMVGTTNPNFALGLILGILSRRVYGDDGTKVEGDGLLELRYEDLINEVWKLDTEVNSLHIGPVDILTVPGELYAELWLDGEEGVSLIENPPGADYPNANLEPALSSLLREDAIRIVVNQANDSLGYIIPQAQFDVEAPHAYEEDGQYGEENSLGYKAGPELFEAVQRMLEL
ncbi:MAG: hypothetical protein VX834_06410 [Myxococcota bacterium]|nr:hypothetical protein [Myxococcota bacterium]